MEESRFKKILREVISTVKTVFICYLVALFITSFIISPIRIDGSSMYPTVENGNFGLSSVISKNLTGIDRFDVVVVYLPESKEYLIKRVIGLPGETVEYKSDVLYIDGTPIEEEFLDNDYVNNYKLNNLFTYDFKTSVIAEDEYFVLGDNRPNSTDSRRYGTVTKNQIKSKGVMVIFPFDKFGIH